MDINVRNLISLDWDIYLNEWRLSLCETSCDLDFWHKFLNRHSALVGRFIAVRFLETRMSFGISTSKQVDLISGILSLIWPSFTFFYETFVQEIFPESHVHSGTTLCESGIQSCQGVTKIFFDAATQPSIGTPGPGHQTPLSPNKTRFQPLIDLFCCLDFVSKFDFLDKNEQLWSCHLYIALDDLGLEPNWPCCCLIY